MTVLNAILGRAFSVLLFPFLSLPAWIGLTAIALITAIAVLYVVKATSSQSRIARVKREIVAGLFEMRLFAGDPRAVLEATAEAGVRLLCGLG